MTVLIQDVRDFLSHRMKSGLLGDATIQAQLETVQFMVDSVKSSDLSSVHEDIIVRGMAAYLAYVAYTTEIETARGELPQSVWFHLKALKEISDILLALAGKPGSASAALGAEGLTGTQRSELHTSRISGSLPEGE